MVQNQSITVVISTLLLSMGLACSVRSLTVREQLNNLESQYIVLQQAKYNGEIPQDAPVPDELLRQIEILIDLVKEEPKKINKQGFQGSSPFWWAFFYAETQCFSEESVAFLETLLRLGAEPNFIYRNGLTPLQLCLQIRELGNLAIAILTNNYCCPFLVDRTLHGDEFLSNVLSIELGLLDLYKAAHDKDSCQHCKLGDFVPAAILAMLLDLCTKEYDLVGEEIGEEEELGGWLTNTAAHKRLVRYAQWGTLAPSQLTPSQYLEVFEGSQCSWDDKLFLDVLARIGSAMVQRGS